MAAGTQTRGICNEFGEPFQNPVLDSHAHKLSVQRGTSAPQGPFVRLVFGTARLFFPESFPEQVKW